MRLLDLFCGAGGAAMGYHQAGFEVVGVDIKHQPRYPFEFHQGDALEFLRKHGHEFDVVHASPPCQGYSYCTPTTHKDKHPKLIAATREALQEVGRPYVIENVAGARRDLINPLMLCGSQFGLKIWRHRYFEIWPEMPIASLPDCDHSFIPVLISGTTRRKGFPRKDPSAAVRREALQTPWMTTTEMDEAIPPAFTRFIGEQLIQQLRRAA